MEHTQKITTVLFDLDGTLLPMELELFMKDYFQRLSQKMNLCGYDGNAVLDNIGKGIHAIHTNKSSRLNEEIFWESLSTAYKKEEASKLKDIFEEFYRVEFQAMQNVCGFTPDAKKAVHFCREHGLDTILATTPLFPAIATCSRVRWAGLDPSDFSYITTYENSSRCKPSPEYYQEILTKRHLKPEECLMVGNDVSEDMPAATLGIQVFLLTDCLINTKNADISSYPQGDYSSLLQFIRRFLSHE